MQTAATGPRCRSVRTYVNLFVSQMMQVPSLDPEIARLCSALTSRVRIGPSCPKSLTKCPAKIGAPGLSRRHARTRPLLVPQKRLWPAAAHTRTSSSVPASGVATESTLPPLRLQTRMLPSQCPQVMYSPADTGKTCALRGSVTGTTPHMLSETLSAGALPPLPVWNAVDEGRNESEDKA